MEKKAQKKDIKEMAKFIAMVVRNNMEDFHVDHLSDKQMKELNPLIRNGIYTALHMLFLAKRTKTLEQMITWTKLMIPDYWEEPELTKDFKNTVKSNFRI